MRLWPTSKRLPPKPQLRLDRISLAARQSSRYNARMTLAARLLLIALIVLTGCVQVRERTRDAAVTTFRVIDTPARYIRDRIDPPQTTTTTTTTTAEASSDVVTPGRPIPPPPPQGPAGSQQRVTASTGTSPAPRATPRPPTSATVAPPRSTSTPASTSATTEFPTAKPVPGKPGFVLSPYDGAYVDVTGFKSGDKARDPKTRQIFIVP